MNDINMFYINIMLNRKHSRKIPHVFSHQRVENLKIPFDYERLYKRKLTMVDQKVEVLTTCFNFI